MAGCDYPCRTTIDHQWQENQGQRPVNKVAAVVIVLLWLAALVGVWFLFRDSFRDA
ncbi:hypothetical protein [Pseudomonas uvaldensis]|uniref:hypothetical protein n=1 Tax=Pseudomonas uvaldensis TaxID=2878385 RepID=UPI001E5DACEC|nr:hypothetical protein [Pseudomonas uvaldensis]MCE0464530.1 hypothetical protein [Pseudomonas uvaldensis]